mmetsp:Transcript_7259/g.16499  ORF Transcript_7259/g.16499 Transcript_7259/m.16499 type:complete len:428 (+) Transcript_7259:59-1342(+)
MTTDLSNMNGAVSSTTQNRPDGIDDVNKLGQNVPMKKRKKTDFAEDGEEAKKARTEDQDDDDDQDEVDGDMKPLKRPPMSKAREIRLEQNRKAARESRRRKKVMIEELQRSVIFFSRANGTLKQQNDELSRLLMQAQAQVAAIESGQQPSQDAQQQPQQAHQPQQAPPQPQQQPQQAPPQPQQQAQVIVKNEADAAPVPQPQNNAQGSTSQVPFQNISQQVQAQAVATQAMYETQGFPPAAARAAAQTMNAGTSGPTTGAEPAGNTPAQPVQQTQAPSLPPMQPGATMQAMANFQQAAAAAMQAAMGMNPAAAAAAASAAASGNPAAANSAAQPTYTDTLNALAMQQAAAVGQAQFAVLGIPQMQQNMTAAPFMAAPMMAQAQAPMAWQQPNGNQNNAGQQADIGQPQATPQVQPPQQPPAPAQQTA